MQDKVFDGILRFIKLVWLPDFKWTFQQNAKYVAFGVHIKPFTDEGQTALFKDPVRTAL